MVKKGRKEIQIKSRARMKRHGEVCTASKEVEAMLELVKEEFNTPDKLFLEPACGDGNFLTAILKRKLANISENDTVNTLSALKSIYGADLLKDNTETARKRLYEITLAHCPKTQSDNFRHDTQRILKENIIQGDFLSGKLFENIKFNVIAGNPPYQIIDGGGTGDSAKPVYQRFIQKAKELNPDYITMIVPSRWMKGGKGLSRFRQEMINDTRLKIIHDFENGQICFPDLHIDGGICYFLWDKMHNGSTEYHHYALDGTKSVTNRFLKNNFSDTVIRDYRQISIIEKASKLNENKFSSIVYSRNPYGFYANLFSFPENYPNIQLCKEPKDKYYKIYGVRGKKGLAKRTFGYVPASAVKKNQTEALSYKLLFSKAYTITSTVPPKIILAKPQEICTETFLQIGNFSAEKEAQNCLSYIKTRFFRALLFFNRHSLNISKKSFNLIPLQDFSDEWNDEKLYEKYGLEQKEIGFINSVIQPMM